MTTAARIEPSQTRRFLFDGVVVDAAASRLFVDGRERICSQRALRLIVVMCESPGVVLTKQQVIDRLWPGGQLISDEALTQAVFRARACLDRYADRLVTVRGVGLRLDAQVRIDEGTGERPAPGPASATPRAPVTPAPAMPATLPPAPPSPPPAALTPPPPPPAARAPAPVAHPVRPMARPRPRFALLLVLALAVTALGYVLLRPPVGPPEPGWLDGGYGLLVSDAHATRDETVAMLREAFAHEGRGDRARARALLETVHSIDGGTPLPALFLSLWSAGGGDAVTARHWLELARERVEPLGSPLLTALFRYAEAEASGTAQNVLRYAGALLDLRPGAWQLHLARAHLLLGDGLRDAALRELEAIDFGTLQHRKLATALADRASLGDVEGAAATLDGIAVRVPEDAMLSYVRGRIEWSRQDLAAAAAAFERTAELARREARFDLYNRSLANLGLVSIAAGDVPGAIDRLERARVGMVESGWARDETDLSLMLAQLHHLQGEADAAARELERGCALATRGNLAVFNDLCLLYRIRLQDAQFDAAATGAEEGTQPLLLAHAALRASDAGQARAALATAARRIAPTSPLHDGLRLLQQRTGIAVDPATPVDPPYPPLVRFTTRLAMQSEGTTP